MSKKAYCPRCAKREILYEMTLVHMDRYTAYWLCMLCGFTTKPMMMGEKMWMEKR